MRGSAGICSRGLAIAEAVRLNLLARERLAAEQAEEAYPELAGAIEDVLANTRQTIRGAADAAALRTALEANAAAVENATVTALVEILAAGEDLSVQGQVASAVQAAISDAQLSTRLEDVADATAGAQAVASYRAEVLSGVEAMIIAAAAAGTPVDVEAELLAAMFVAASVGPDVR